MSLENVTKAIENSVGRASGLNAKVKFDFGDDGIVFIDNTETPPIISHDDEEADCTLICTLDTFQGFLDGTKDPNMAFMMGKLKVKGSLGLAMKLNAILED